MNMNEDTPEVNEKAPGRSYQLRFPDGSRITTIIGETSENRYPRATTSFASGYRTTIKKQEVANIILSSEQKYGPGSYISFFNPKDNSNHYYEITKPLVNPDYIKDPQKKSETLSEIDGSIYAQQITREKYESAAPGAKKMELKMDIANENGKNIATLSQAAVLELQ
jgi:hypothetical protein